MIRIEHVSKSFRNGSGYLKALDDVSLTLPERGFVFLLGKSGSGKSTLLNLVGGLDKSEGTIDYGLLMKEEDRKDFDDFRRRNVGYVFQDFYLDEEATVFENIRQGLAISGIEDMEEVRKRADSSLKAVGLVLYKRRKASQLSLGQKQRLAIARAISIAPKIILADEPTGNLDSKNGEKVMQILKGLSKNILILCVSHNENIATRYGDLIYRIKDGKVRSDESSEKKTVEQVVEKEADIETMATEIGSLSISLFQEKGLISKEEITILRQNGKTLVNLPKGFQVVEEDIRQALSAKKKHQEAILEDATPFETSSFDSEKRTDRFFRKALFRGEMSRKGNRVLAIVSILLAILFPLGVGLRFGLYETTLDSLMLQKRDPENEIALRPIDTENDVGFPYTFDMVEMLGDPESGIVGIDSTVGSLSIDRFEAAEIPFGSPLVNEASLNISFFYGASSLRDSSVSSSLSLSKLKYGEVLVSRNFANSYLRQSLKTGTLDSVVGTKLSLFDPSGNPMDYTIAGLVDSSSYSYCSLYFGGMDFADAQWILRFSGVQNQKLSYVLSKMTIAFRQDIQTPLASKALRQKLYPCAKIDSNLKSDESADLFDPGSTEKEILYLPQGNDAFLRSLLETCFGSMPMFYPERAEDHPEVELQETHQTKEGQIGIYLSKNIYDALTFQKEDDVILGGFSAADGNATVVVQGYYEVPDDHDVPSMLTIGDDFVYCHAINDSAVAYSGYPIIHDGYYYVALVSQDVKKTKAYLESRYPDYVLLDLEKYNGDLLDMSNFNILFSVILLAGLLLILLYALFFNSRLVQDERTIAIYRALGLDKKVIFVHYLLDILKRITLFFTIPYILIALGLAGTSLAVSPLIHFLTILSTYGIVLIAVLVPLLLLLSKTPHQLLLKKDV